MKMWLVGAALGWGMVAGAAPVVEELGELKVDFSAGTVEVGGVGAPSLRTPTAQVGRAESERKARRDALARLGRGLEALGRERLGCRGAEELPRLGPAVMGAEPSAIDWGSDGSVRLRLRVALGALAAEGAALDMDKDQDKGKTGPVVLVDGEARPRLFEGESCRTARPAPPVFETLAEARARVPAVAEAEVMMARERPRSRPVIAIVRRKP